MIDASNNPDIKLIIAGTRDLDLNRCPIATNNFTELANIGYIINKYYPNPSVISWVYHGNSGVVDKSGSLWAYLNNIPQQGFDPDWDNLEGPNARIKTNKWGKPYNANAGPTRNADMALRGDELLVIMRSTGSPGSKNMIDYMKFLNKPVHIHLVKDRK